MKIIHVLAILASLTRLGFSAEGDVKFVEMSPKNPSAEIMAQDLSKFYSLSWNPSSLVTTELAASNGYNPYRGGSAIRMPDSYQCGVRVLEPLEENEAIGFTADVVVKAASEPTFTVGTEYLTQNSLFVKADFTPLGGSNFKMAFGYKTALVELAYIFAPERESHSIGFVKRIS